MIPATKVKKKPDKTPQPLWKATKKERPQRDETGNQAVAQRPYIFLTIPDSPANEERSELPEDLRAELEAWEAVGLEAFWNTEDLLE